MNYAVTAGVGAATFFAPAFFFGDAFLAAGFLAVFGLAALAFFGDAAFFGEAFLAAKKI